MILIYTKKLSPLSTDLSTGRSWAIFIQLEGAPAPK